jgi:hypothetical protein
MFLMTAMDLAEENHNLHSQLTLLCDHTIATRIFLAWVKSAVPRDFLVRRTAASSAEMQTDSTSDGSDFLVVVSMCVSEMWTTEKLPAF